MIYLTLFLTFLKIGAFTFGGGYAMLPLIEQAVEAKQWMDLKDLVNFIAVSESTPGPFAINVSTYVGRVTAGIPGAICATLGVILPSFIIILLVAKFFLSFKDNKYVKYTMSGLKPAVVGLIAAAMISVGREVFFPDCIGTVAFLQPKLYISLVIFGTVVLLSYKKVHPIRLIVLAAVFGILAGVAGFL